MKTAAGDRYESYPPSLISIRQRETEKQAKNMVVHPTSRDRTNLTTLLCGGPGGSFGGSGGVFGGSLLSSLSTGLPLLSLLFRNPPKTPPEPPKLPPGPPQSKVVKLVLSRLVVRKTNEQIEGKFVAIFLPSTVALYFIFQKRSLQKLFGPLDFLKGRSVWGRYWGKYNNF